MIGRGAPDSPAEAGEGRDDLKRTELKRAADLPCWGVDNRYKAPSSRWRLETDHEIEVLHILLPAPKMLGSEKRPGTHRFC
jgi:hypothetical protein